MSMETTAALDKMIFRKTQSAVGRHVAVSPSNSPMQHLSYGRIILGSAQPTVTFKTGDRETALVCLSGEARVTVGSAEFTLNLQDALYVPRDSDVTVSAAAADLAEFSAEVANRYPMHHVRAEDVTPESGLKFSTGGPGSTRTVSMLVTKNVQAGRLLVGITTSDPGNWTSWPPHEHAKMLEEMYVYFDMPHPAYGIQLVYNNTEYPELVTVVRDGDVVLMPAGFHPNVSVPGHRISFLWAMAAHREVEDRKYGVVNVQPDFGAVGLNRSGATVK